MISQEKKDQIESIKKEYFRLAFDLKYSHDNLFNFWTLELTKYAEKLEEKDKEIEGFKEAVQNLHGGYDICKSDYQKVIAKYKTQLESKDHELAQLKEIGSRLFNSLRDLDFMLSVFDPRVSQNDIRIKVFTLMDMAEKLNGANKT